MKMDGYIVMESCEDYEQGLGLLTGDAMPVGGVLRWSDDECPVAMFASRAGARAAINRTEHYRLAFGRSDLPEKRFCRLKPIRAVKETKP